MQSLCALLMDAIAMVTWKREKQETRPFDESRTQYLLRRIVSRYDIIHVSYNINCSCSYDF
jgi:hypothetical protein